MEGAEEEGERRYLEIQLQKLTLIYMGAHSNEAESTRKYSQRQKMKDANQRSLEPETGTTQLLPYSIAQSSQTFNI